LEKEVNSVRVDGRRWEQSVEIRILAREKVLLVVHERRQNAEAQWEAEKDNKKRSTPDSEGTPFNSLTHYQRQRP
jgi:hypothetical protein